jgi:hypothetical protein
MSEDVTVVALVAVCLVGAAGYLMRKAHLAKEARTAEEARKAERARKAEEEQKAQAVRKAEEAREAEEARRAAEAARKADEARRAEEGRQAEAARHAQEARRAAEAARKAEQTRKAEERTNSPPPEASTTPAPAASSPAAPAPVDDSALTPEERRQAVIARVLARRDGVSATAEIEKADPAHAEARRVARLFVSELKLYHPVEVEEGKTKKDMWTRLYDDFKLTQQTYAQRVPAEVRAKFDYLYDEIVKQLCDGNPTALGPMAPKADPPRALS